MVTVFESADRAREAIGRLEQGGFDASRISVLGKEELSAVHQLGMGFAGERARTWGRKSPLWNSLPGAPAMALAWVPFIGHVIAVGPAAAVIAGSSWETRTESRTSVLRRMLTLVGMSAGEVQTYEAAVRGGQILLLVHGGTREAARARRLLNDTVH